MPEMLTCWCGNTDLGDFNQDYRLCRQCQTLVWEGKGQTGDLREFYGKKYWFEHQMEELDLPDIYQRARQDLTGRVLFWLRTSLQLRYPPGKILEIGSGHGGLVALLNRAGFEASGLEVDPEVSNIAVELFDIPMLSGFLEEQDLQEEEIWVEW